MKSPHTAVTQDTQEAAYKEAVDAWVLAAVNQGTQSFDELLLALPGVYPVDVLDSMRRLKQLNRVPAAVLAEAEAYVVEPASLAYESELLAELPPPHPLDFSWRFGDGAVEHILQRCFESCGPNGMVVLLGAPSILVGAGRGNCARRFVLFDSDRATANATKALAPRARVVCCDLLSDPPPDVQGTVVVLDPPWYPEFMRAFLWVASKVSSPGGKVLQCFPPKGTRAGVEREWTGIKGWAEELGFRLGHVERGVLPYVSPPFERNALAASGIYTVPGEWRRADLATFYHERKVCVSRPPSPQLPGRWPEEVVQGIRLRVKQSGGPSPFDPTLRSIVPGNVLPSVSRRDKRRAQVDVWTQGNRVFACSGPATLLTILSALSDGQHPHEAVAAALKRDLNHAEKTQVERAVGQITELVETERHEIVRFHTE